MIAECRYCGQIYDSMVETEDENIAQECATMMCKCDGAKHYQNQKRREEKTKDNIDLALFEENEKAADFLKQGVPLILEHKLAKITIDTGNGQKVTVSMTNKGNMKVDKTSTKKVVFDE